MHWHTFTPRYFLLLPGLLLKNENHIFSSRAHKLNQFSSYSQNSGIVDDIKLDSEKFRKLIRLKHYKEAIETYERNENPSLDDGILIICLFTTVLKPGRARKIAFDIMLSLNKTAFDSSAQTAILHLMLKCHCKADKLDMAERILSHWIQTSSFTVSESVVEYQTYMSTRKRVRKSDQDSDEIDPLTDIFALLKTFNNTMIPLSSWCDMLELYSTRSAWQQCLMIYRIVKALYVDGCVTSHDRNAMRILSSNPHLKLCQEYFPSLHHDDEMKFIVSQMLKSLFEAQQYEDVIRIIGEIMNDSDAEESLTGTLDEELIIQLLSEAILSLPHWYREDPSMTSTQNSNESVTDLYRLSVEVTKTVIQNNQVAHGLANDKKSSLISNLVASTIITLCKRGEFISYITVTTVERPLLWQRSAIIPSIALFKTCYYSFRLCADGG
jgi:hypothetical protein